MYTVCVLPVGITCVCFHVPCVQVMGIIIVFRFVHFVCLCTLRKKECLARCLCLVVYVWVFVFGWVEVAIESGINDYNVQHYTYTL